MNDSRISNMKMNFLKSVCFVGISIMCSCNTPDDEKRIAHEQIKLDNELKLTANSQQIEKLLLDLDRLDSTANSDQEFDIRTIADKFIKDLHIHPNPDSLVQFKQLVRSTNSQASPSRIRDITNEISNMEILHTVDEARKKMFKSAKYIIVDILKYHHNYIKLNTVKGVLNSAG